MRRGGRTIDTLLLIGGVLIVFSIVLVPLSARLGAPVLLLFLAVGMAMGEDGPGGIAFNDFTLAYEIGTVALALILFSGGLDTPLRDIRRVAGPATVLATVGVALTALVVGVAASVVLDVDLTTGILLGAVVASTDAAATFLLLRQSGVRLAPGIGETITVESGLNDPMAIFLTVTFVTLVDSGVTVSWGNLPGLALELVRQLGIGAVAGLAGGAATAWLVGRITLPAGLQAPMALAAALAVFAATRLAGGSGFLAAYLFGVAFAHRADEVAPRVGEFHEGIAWLGQIVMFLMLGLLVTPSELPATLLPALAIAAVLMLVARPLAVLACLAPFGMPLRQQAYVGWVGLRGAVPIFLAIIPVISPGPVTIAFFNVVFVVVIASLVLQGWTISPMARWLKVTRDA